MLFNSFIYPLFLTVTVLIYWILPARFRVYAICLFSVLFYSYYDIPFLFLIVALACFVHAIYRFKHKKSVFIGGIGIIILVLIVFKYGNLLAESFTRLFSMEHEAIRLIMPLGISFFTFEFIHFLVDVYHKKIPPHKPSEFFAFALFFPTLVSGPIKRFQTFLSSLREKTGRLTPEYFLTGLLFILIGYAEKYFIADNLVDRTAFLAAPELVPSTASILSGLFFYSWRIYFDFGGLSLIAIGSALLFGITIPINFSRPYTRKDIAGFWRHWHMSLTSWIRDYVYMPLVFRFRHNKIIMSLSLLFTMALIGLWHGSSWNFLFFGIYHGIGLTFLQLWRSKKIRLPLRLPAPVMNVLGVITTFIFVMFGWPFFVTHSLHDSLLLYERLFGIFF